MYNKILIPLDISDADKVILDHIRPLARMMRSHLILLHVADGFVARNQEAMNLHDSPEIREDRAYLSSCAATLIEEGYPTTFILERGEPAEQVLAVAGNEGCDLIAMATHGHGPIADFILGSVAEKVRHKTDIPVLMIRAPQ